MKILLPVDGSELSLHEVRFAMQLVAQGLQAEFLLVNVQEPVTLFEMVTAPDAEVLQSVSHAAGDSALQAAIQLLRDAGLSYETEVASGDPAHALLDIVESHGCELVVMGTRGAGPLLAAWQGSVAQSLLHNCPVPVLLVKPPVEQPPEALENDSDGVGEDSD